ncbi:DUF4238 domain-containing protein [Deinococcus sp. SDU3-2]|uniref:DUF4238 domain-containing protein n=1 Tax=Deinococcus terrestris TaxID=2651870 RepID=A0A7X1NUJ8_9DEIO|nr:DUF4238 domain-containing protein [Deinococcus terrestris]MPY65960.1 DUF4238 domain-containing protein [Deinococcus terrestris]
MDDWAKNLMGSFHHYVPKFYLRRFANSRGQITAYDLQKKRSFLANINKIAGERGLNSLIHMDFEDENQRVFIEQLFSELESKYAVHAEAVLKMIDNEINLIEESRYGLAHMMFTQIYRSPRFRNLYNEVIERSWLSYIESRHGQDSKLKNFIPEPKDYSFHIVKMMFDPKTGGADMCEELVSEFYWMVLVNKSQTPFLTSDNPVIIYSQNGVKEVVYYPLSPKICIQLLRKERYPEFLERDGMHLHSRDKRAAIDINHNLFSTAERFVFGLPPNTFIENLVT